MMNRTIKFKLNGEAVTAEVPAHWNLVELLQNRFALFGARESCGQGLCGACTVLVNATAVSGCLYLAAFGDAEHALDAQYAKKLGVELENLLVSQPDNGEQALEIVEVLVRSGGVDVIVIDRVEQPNT